MLIFYLIAFIVNLAIFAGFMFRHRQTQEKPYLHLGLAVLAQAISAALMAFLGDMIFGSVIVYLAIIYAASIIASLGGLVMVLVVVQLIRTWIASMQSSGGAHVATVKLDKSDRVCGYLRIAYPALTAASIIFYVLLIVSLGFAAILVLVVGIAFLVVIVAQCAILVWMYLDLHNRGVTTDLEIRKRNQLLRLMGMTFFGGSPIFFSGLGAGIGGSVALWVFYGIALWPNSLVGMEEPIAAAGATGGVTPGVSAGGYGAEPKYPPNYGYQAQPSAYSQAGGYQADTTNYANAPTPAPQAAYQPQYQQQQGGQPQQPYGAYQGR